MDPDNLLFLESIYLLSWFILLISSILLYEVLELDSGLREGDFKSSLIVFSNCWEILGFGINYVFNFYKIS